MREDETIGGTGVPPVEQGFASKDEKTTGADSKRRQQDEAVVTEDGIHIRQGANLPHWTREGAIYTVTFRLADSLPRAALHRFAREREAARDLIDATERKGRLAEISVREEEALNGGAGACLLAREDTRAIVAGALRHFDGTRYALFAYALMPNHVHVLLRPTEPNTLSRILHAWKSFTAKEIPGVSGQVWQPESYDHLIRGERDFAAQLAYIQLNPERAGLKGGFEVWTAPNLDELWSQGKGGTGVPPVEQGSAFRDEQTEGARVEGKAGGTGVSPVEQGSAFMGEQVGGETLHHRRDADDAGEISTGGIS